MGIEAVSYSGDHDPGDEDHHGKGDDAAVAREFGTPGGGRQLNLTDQGDRGDHNFTLGAFLHCHRCGRLRASQVLFCGFFSHFFFALGDVSYLASQARFRKPDQGGSCEEEGGRRQLRQQHAPANGSREVERHLLSQVTRGAHVPLIPILGLLGSFAPSARESEAAVHRKGEREKAGSAWQSFTARGGLQVSFISVLLCVSPVFSPSTEKPES